MIGTLQQSLNSYMMLQEQDNDLDLPQKSNPQPQQESGSENEEPVKQHLKINHMPSARLKPRKKTQKEEEIKLLSNQFFKLITFVNQHYRPSDRQPAEESLNQIWPQPPPANRAQKKRPPPKILKAGAEESKPLKDEKSKWHMFEKQSFKEFDMPGKKAEEGFPVFDTEEEISKKNIWRNYSQVMLYAVHDSEDEGDCYKTHVPIRQRKSKIMESCLSEYSFAQSSMRHAEEKERGKLRMEKMVHIHIAKSVLQLGIFPQFQVSNISQPSVLDTCQMEAQNEQSNIAVQ